MPFETPALARHTPGPWALLDDRIAAPCLEHRNCEKTIAWLGRDEPDYEPLQCTHTGGQYINARLIAAAPDLLAVAQCLVCCEDENDLGVFAASVDNVIAMAKLAIAKAEGR
jgi:hypothetical protein